MSGLHDAFAEIVADVPVYGDLDRAIEQADLEQGRRYGMVAGLAAAAAIAVIIGVLTITNDGKRSQPPIEQPTPSKSQSPQTWVDTAVPARDGYGWDVPDPLKAARDAWFPIVTEHLGSKTAHFESDVRGVSFDVPAEGSAYNTDVPSESKHSTSGQIGLMVDSGDLNPLDNGCGYIRAQHEGVLEEQVSCSTTQFRAPSGEQARISSWGRRCSTWEHGLPAPATCGDYVVTVAVERRDGLIGYVAVNGRGTPDFNPFTADAMAAAAADPRLTLPEVAYTVPSGQVVTSVVADHFPRFQVDEHQVAPSTQRPGSADTWGHLGPLGLEVRVLPAGKAPTCGGGNWLIECLQRRVYGAGDPTTVFVGAWDEEDWADCCPRNSRADSRVFVYVGPRHTVVVSERLIVKADEEPISADLDQRMIDLLLDPRLQ